MEPSLATALISVINPLSAGQRQVKRSTGHRRRKEHSAGLGKGRKVLTEGDGLRVTFLFPCGGKNSNHISQLS